MKYLKKFKLFESEETLKGWRAQNSEILHPTTGEKATEGEGYYLFDRKEDAVNWYNAKYVFEIEYKVPRKAIHVEFLGHENSFLFWGEDEEGVLLKPIKKKDSDWIKFHKLAIKHGGEDLTTCIKEFTRLLISAGYDAVVIDDEPYWTILLNPSLIISSNRIDNIDYKPFTFK